MSYTPTTWANGDTITAEKMNNIEQGIVAASGGGGVLVVNMDNDTETLDKTWQEIADAGTAIIVIRVDASRIISYMVTDIYQETDDYRLACFSQLHDQQGDTGEIFVADSPNGYPVID